MCSAHPIKFTCVTPIKFALCVVKYRTILPPNIQSPFVIIHLLSNKIRNFHNNILLHPTAMHMADLVLISPSTKTVSRYCPTLPVSIDNCANSLPNVKLVPDSSYSTLHSRVNPSPKRRNSWFHLSVRDFDSNRHGHQIHIRFVTWSHNKQHVVQPTLYSSDMNASSLIYTFSHPSNHSTPSRAWFWLPEDWGGEKTNDRWDERLALTKIDLQTFIRCHLIPIYDTKPASIISPEFLRPHNCTALLNPEHVVVWRNLCGLFVVLKPLYHKLPLFLSSAPHILPHTMFPVPKPSSGSTSLYT